MKKVIQVPAGKTDGPPLSSAVQVGSRLYLSGQTPMNMVTGKFVEGDITVQTKQVLENIKQVLEACDAGLDQVVKVVVYLTDLSDFGLFNEMYKQYFSVPYPVRTLVGAKLLFTFKVEIDVIAELGE